MGQKVGDGECWTLANDALVAVGSNCSSRGQEPCMASQSYVHGSLIYCYVPGVSPYPEPRGGVGEAGVARGDILQLLSTHFKSKDGRTDIWAGGMYIFESLFTFGPILYVTVDQAILTLRSPPAPDHTAVITGVQASGLLNVVEQNVGSVKKVQEGSYDMSELVRGEVRIFRAVSESWVGKLDPTW
jgi:hypothetical protein